MKTWADIEKAAFESPILRGAVALVNCGYATREEAVLIAALALSEIAIEQTAKLERLIEHGIVPPHIFIQDWPPEPYPAPLVLRKA